MNHSLVNSAGNSPGLHQSPLRFLQLLSLMIFALLAPAIASAASSKEYQIKAAFLYNFTQFVEWPATSFASPDAPLVIAILGNDPFGTALHDIVHDEKVNGHPLVIKHIQRTNEINGCHLLFVPQSESKHLDEILAASRGQNILTVGESEGFAQNGGVIRFVNEKNKIRLRVNVDAAKDAGLTVSSKLLKLAEIVTTKKD